MGSSWDDGGVAAVAIADDRGSIGRNMESMYITILGRRELAVFGHASLLVHVLDGYSTIRYVDLNQKSTTME